MSSHNTQHLLAQIPFEHFLVPAWSWSRMLGSQTPRFPHPGVPQGWESGPGRKDGL